MILKDFTCNEFISLDIPSVNKHKHEIKPADERVRDGQIAPDGQFVVVAAVDGVAGRQHAAARVHDQVQAGLVDGHGLLLHALVDGHPVLLVQLVELVDAQHALVRQDHRARLDVPVPVLVEHHSRGESHARTALAGGVDAVGRDVHHGAQQLGLAAARVAAQQDVHVPAQSAAVLHVDFVAAKQLQQECLFDVLLAFDVGTDWLS